MFMLNKYFIIIIFFFIVGVHLIFRRYFDLFRLNALQVQLAVVLLLMGAH